MAWFLLILFGIFGIFPPIEHGNSDTDVVFRTSRPDLKIEIYLSGRQIIGIRNRGIVQCDNGAQRRQLFAEGVPSLHSFPRRAGDPNFTIENLTRTHMAYLPPSKRCKDDWREVRSEGKFVFGNEQLRLEAKPARDAGQRPQRASG